MNSAPLPATERLHAAPALHRSTCESGKGQRGFALFITLIFLVVLTLIGLTAMQVASLEERMAGNLGDRSRAFSAAETSLRIASANIPVIDPFDRCVPPRDPPDAADPDCVGGICRPGAIPDYNTYNWSAGTVHVTVDTSAIDSTVATDLSASPKYFMECRGRMKLPGGDFKPIIGITAHATGKNSNTNVNLAASYRLP